MYEFNEVPFFSGMTWKPSDEFTKTKTYRCDLKECHQNPRYYLHRFNGCTSFFRWFHLEETPPSLDIQNWRRKFCENKFSNVFFLRVFFFFHLLLVKSNQEVSFGVSFSSSLNKSGPVVHGKQKTIIINKIRSFLAQIFFQK